jgi:hypothetical protein
VYATWDFTDEQQSHYNALSRSQRLSVRAVEQSSREPAAEVETQAESRHWFLNVPWAAANYSVQLGYYRADGEWTTVRESGPVSTPPDRISERRAARFSAAPQAAVAGLPSGAAGPFPTIPLEEILARIGSFIPEREMAETKHHETLKTPVLPADGTARRVVSLRQVYSGIYGVEDVPGHLSSLGLAGGEHVEAITSGFGPKAQPKRGFWFNVDAELIVYGATEPDAQVTMGGRSIQLRPDGTFSFRIALPDGDYALPLAATSADTREVRYAELRFRRESDYGSSTET